MVLFFSYLERAATTLTSSDDEVLQAVGTVALMRLETLNLHLNKGQQHDHQNLVFGEGSSASIARQDMVEAERGGMWPLSSYSPQRGLCSFPGFEDSSVEEERFKYYEAKKNGKLKEYEKQFQISLNEAQMKIRAMQNPSPKVVQLLKSFYGS